jgi:hypothetical protein
VIVLTLSALLLAGVILLVPLGFRTGDQPGDVRLEDVVPSTSPRGASVTVTNPGRVPVILGLSLRRAGPRLRLDGPSYVRVRSGRTSSDLLAGDQALVGVLDAGATETFAIGAGPEIGRRGELVAVIGQPRRLRTIHRLVVLPSGASVSSPAALEARAPGVRKPPARGSGGRGHHQHSRPGADRQSDHVRERERSQAADRQPDRRSPAVSACPDGHAD